MRRITALIALLVLAVPAAAAAQTPPAQPQPTPPAEPAAPAPGTLRAATQSVGSDGLVLAGSRWGVVGKLQPGVAGQVVAVRLYRGGKKVAAQRVRTRADGLFRARFRTGGTGRYLVRASHRRSAEVDTAVAKVMRVAVLPKSVGPSSSSTAIRALQQRLDELGYVVGARGRFDDRTARAVLAFRKVTGMARTSSADRAVMSRIARGGGAYRLRFPQHGKHVEADLSRQVLVLARGNKVERIYPTSSGAPATPTIRGSYRFYMSQPGLNNKEMYYSQYFIRGYAIHGYKSVPTYNASHGCLRVPIPDAVSIYNWIKLGDRIDVYA